MKQVPDIKDVAVAAGVSISTVSRVLNHSGNVAEELKERVHAAVKETGYILNPIASNLKSTKRNQIAIVIPTLRRTYYTDIIKGVSDYCYEKGTMPVILETNGRLSKEMEIITNLERQWIDGIILIPGQKSEGADYDEYVLSLQKLTKRDTSIPVVLMEADDSGTGLDIVRVNHRDAFYVMAEHLLELGRRKLVFIANSKDVPLYRFTLEGVRSAAAAYGCELGDECIKTGNYTVLDGYKSMLEFMNEGIRPDGVICVNDQVASGALAALQENGYVLPEEVAIVGFGGVALSIVTAPSITTMIVPRYQMGRTAATMLYERMGGSEAPPRREVIKAHLAVRESTMRSAGKRLDLMFME